MSEIRLLPKFQKVEFCRNIRKQKGLDYAVNMLF